jgi:molybdopterin molybdotransferase
MALMDVDAALAQLLGGAAALPAEMVAVGAAAGRVLAEAITARLTQPPFDAAAMDGYAIRWADLPGPWRIVGEAAAGHGWGGTLGPGEAARIFTGAPLPAGADTIIVQEEIRRSDDIATLAGEGPPHARAHVRACGQDFAAGDVLLAAGARVTAPRLGLAAAAGHGKLSVVRRPRVVLIATGDELVAPGGTPCPGQIFSSNSVMLAALFTAAGAEVSDPGIIRDDRDALAAALQGADADLIVTTRS